jgi:AraC-like DNA-binding protein
MSRPDRHNEIEWGFLPGGAIVFLLDNKRVEVPADRTYVFWAARPHQDLELGSAEPAFVVTIPLAMFLQWQLPRSLVHTLLRGHVVVECQTERSSADLELYRQWYQDLLHPNPSVVQAVKLEMEARLRRLAITSCPQPQRETQFSVAKPPLLGKIEQMALYVSQNYTEAVRAADVGNAVGLHPDYAAALFRRAFGVTLHEYLVEIRIQHAQHLLSTTDAAILSVALDCGFGAVSRFNASFKARCGCTPRAYRRFFRNRAT